MTLIKSQEDWKTLSLHYSSHIDEPKSYPCLMHSFSYYNAESEKQTQLTFFYISDATELMKAWKDNMKGSWKKDLETVRKELYEKTYGHLND